MIRSAALRALAFFALAGLPTVVFDVVYWQAPLPDAALLPVEAALRLTVVAFVVACFDGMKSPWTPVVCLALAALTYGAGFIEGEYLNGMLQGRGALGGMDALSVFVRRVQLHPGYLPILLTIVATPFGAASFARVHRLPFGATIAVTTMSTLLVVALLLEPFLHEVGRVTAAFVGMRTLYVALALPVVERAAERLDRRHEPPHAG